MAHLGRNAPPIAVVLASLLLWGSFAWALPADTPPVETEAEVAADDPWAGARISDAYDYAECAACGKKNRMRAESCSRCGHSLPQPSGEVTDPAWVFVPGKGYYREGTLLEPGNKRTGMLIWGLVLVPAGLITTSVAGSLHARGNYESISPYIIPGIGGLAAAGVGGVLIIVAISTAREPVYAFGGEEFYRPYDRALYASPDSEGGVFKAEVTLLSF